MSLALVTGATSGIGRAIAVALRAAGHEVVALGRQQAALDVLAHEHGIRGIALDLTDRAALAAALDGLEVDILVNNAGMMPPLAHFCDTVEADMERAVAVNLSSVLALTRLVAPGMRERKHGHIFFTGSTAGHTPFANLAVYCATKAAIGGFAQALRLDMAPSGVRVTEIVAGRVETDLYRDVLPQEARAAMYAGSAAVQPGDVAAMLIAALNLPVSVDVARFDILPTHQTTPPAPARKES
jgi:NADP-dependent 3-hydroxy acid dehydrogenase YdfG